MPVVVDWPALLGIPVKVRFNTFAVPETRLVFERSVAEFDLPDGTTVDISWIGRRSKYVIKRFGDDYHNPISRREAFSCREVVPQVRFVVAD